MWRVEEFDDQPTTYAVVKDDHPATIFTHHKLSASKVVAHLDSLESLLEGVKAILTSNVADDVKVSKAKTLLLLK